MKNIIRIIICLSAGIILYSCHPVVYTTAPPPHPVIVTPAPIPQTVAPPPLPIEQPRQQEYAPPQPEYAYQPVYQEFYDDLSPYGSWVEYPSYGYVWIPRVSYDFEPYSTRGHWVFTDQGWTWYSDYNWGWAPFHYGRWFVDDRYGWIWVPGHEWAPAWVTWGSYNNYYCWAPISPGISRYDDYRPPKRYWHFVPSNHINEYDAHNYFVNSTTVINNVSYIRIINNTSRYNNATYNQGPGREEVEKLIHKRITVVPIRETSRPTYGSDNSRTENEKSNRNDNYMQIYRPKVGRDNEQKNIQVRPVPKKVEKIESIQPVRQQPDMDIQQQNKKVEPVQQPGGNSNQPVIKQPMMNIQQQNKKIESIQEPKDKNVQPVNQQQNMNIQQQNKKAETIQESRDKNVQPAQQKPMMNIQQQNKKAAPMQEPRNKNVLPANQLPNMNIQQQNKQLKPNQQPKDMIKGKEVGKDKDKEKDKAKDKAKEKDTRDNKKIEIRKQDSKDDDQAKPKENLPIRQ
jgi:hypothetical protein